MFHAVGLVVLGVQVYALHRPSQEYVNFCRPTAFHVGADNPESPSGFSRYAPGHLLKLDPSSPVLTLDYGADVAGFPALNVQSISKPAQIELKYSEPYDGLSLPYSDGPLSVILPGDNLKLN